MNITFLGAGYVGATTAAHFAGPHEVTVYDIDDTKIDGFKNVMEGSREFPIHEDGLVEKIQSNKDRITPTNNIEDALANPDIIFIAVGTPPNEKGRANLTYVVEAAKQIGQTIKKDTIILTKSTVPPGTGYMIKKDIQKELDERGSKINVSVGSCPEFLAEGTAMKDLHSPARVVFGMEDIEATEKIIQMFSSLYSREKIVNGTVIESELTKYVANAALANKLSFYNEMSLLCDKLGADGKKVINMACKDPRIGNQFNKPGFGYGGSCFPKDTKAIAQYADLIGMPLEMVEATIKVNENVLNTFENKIYEAFNGSSEDKDMRDINIGIWGIGFKANTDDLRESKSVELAKRLMNNGAHVHVYDIIPGALKNFKNELNNYSGQFTIHQKQYDMFENGIDGLVIGNESMPFRTINHDKVTAKKIFDGKNQISPIEIKELTRNGVAYFSVGQDIYAGEVDKEVLIKTLKESYMD